MIYFKKIFWLSTLILFGILSLAQAQVDSSEVDSSYQAYIKNAWSEFEKSMHKDKINGDSLQLHYSNEFYD